MSHKGDSAKRQASRLLKHYFNLTIDLDDDNRVEIEEIIDCIVTVAVEEVKDAISAGKDTF